ncbi:MAG: hypothetical protein GF330_08125 [Candidatus Eisenbacteria bacterium]|nr:hypothetical protein [Candidatus Eisenbacteria bacterium]
MRALLIVCGILVCASPAFGDAEVSYGPAVDSPVYEQRQDICQYGFQDDQSGSGWTLSNSQQLGITCPGPMCITEVGFWVEFCIEGNLDIVIYDDGVEVSRTSVYVGEGENQFDIDDVTIAGAEACIMLCPTTFNGVTGEDYTNGPFGDSYWSSDCECTNAFTDNNLMIWAYVDDASPADSETWGSLKTLFW